jgi:hypothetical protein
MDGSPPGFLSFIISGDVMAAFDWWWFTVLLQEGGASFSTG